MSSRIPAVVDESGPRGGTPRVEDSYPTAVAPREAAQVLRGLAATLRRLPGAFGDDARTDAARLTVLADDIAGRWRHHGRVGGAGDGQDWAALMQIYFRAALEPDGRGPDA